MQFKVIELLGLTATVILVISMSFSCRDNKSTIIMRSINALSNVLFMIYGFTLGAYSVMLSNAFILGIDTYYIKTAIKDLKIEKMQKNLDKILKEVEDNNE